MSREGEQQFRGHILNGNFVAVIPAQVGIQCLYKPFAGKARE